MEKYSFEKAENEADLIRKKALEAKERRGEVGEPTGDDYENAYQSKEYEKLAKEARDENCLTKVINQVENSQFQGETTRSSGVEFGFQWQQNMPQKLIELLKGKNITDLGAGDSSKLAAYLGCVGESPKINAVDAEGKNFQQEKWETNRRELEMPDAIKFYRDDINRVKGDMLEFISRLPDDYGNFTINGIDTNIINNGKYIDYLLFHLNRCVPSGGIIFGINTRFLSRLEEEYGFKNITEEITGNKNARNLDKRIYQKP